MSIERKKLEVKINELEIKYRGLEIEYYNYKNKILKTEIELEEEKVTFEDLFKFYEENIKDKYSDDDMEKLVKKIESNPISEEKKEDYVVFADDSEFKFYSMYKYGTYKLLMNNLSKEKLSLLREIKSLTEELIEMD